ncbi:MAG: carboxypeptidase-like regulatory domain-containing protein, partial [Cytophagaceae bacterium]
MNILLRYTSLRLPILLLSGLLLFSSLTRAQTTTVTGTITDAVTNQPLAFANVIFVGTNTGTTSNEKGAFTLTATGNYTKIAVSFIGYKLATRTITPGTSQTVAVKLESDSQLLNEVVIRSGKRERYRNKNNPAVELIRNVISHKDQNQIGNYAYAAYEEYDKLQFSLSSLSSKISERKMFQKYRFLLDNRDTTTLPGKSLLPIYLEEKIADHYFRKSPLRDKVVIKGNKRVDFGQYFDNNGLSLYLNRMYSKVDIYSNSIFLMTNQFLSPIAN